MRVRLVVLSAMLIHLADQRESAAAAYRLHHPKNLRTGPVPKDLDENAGVDVLNEFFLEEIENVWQNDDVH